jgi:flagellar M-ring protein FliF
MEKSLATISPAANQAASTETDPTAPLGRAGAARRWLGSGRLIVLGSIALGLLGLLISLLLRVPEPHYAPLYWDLPLDDSAAIVGRLEALGVPFRQQEDGRAILVAAGQASRLRMTLAEEGLPRGRTAATKIFDRQSTGTVDFPANVRLRRGLERELARTIASLADVGAARVHLVLPRQDLLRRRQIPPSASVTLHMDGGGRLAPRQAQAVQHLVAAAVPALSPGHVVLIDDHGILLARGDEGAPRGMAHR